MTKNVNVVDESGNRYVPTYAKRAKGLVKNGRARWVDENTICLACPPNDLNSEDADMENTVRPVEISLEARKNMAQEILARMDKIIAQGENYMDLVREIKDIPVNDSPSGGLDGAARADAIGNVYAAREQTNQMMLNMLQQMYNDSLNH